MQSPTSIPHFPHLYPEYEISTPGNNHLLSISLRLRWCLGLLLGSWGTCLGSSGLGLGWSPKGLAIGLADIQKWNSFVTYQVVSQELHDESRVLVALLAQSIEFYHKWSVKSMGKEANLFQTEKPGVYSPAIASSKACLARWHAWSGEFRIS